MGGRNYTFKDAVMELLRGEIGTWCGSFPPHSIFFFSYIFYFYFANHGMVDGVFEAHYRATRTPLVVVARFSVLDINSFVPENYV